MAKVQTKGACRLCGKEFTKGGMSRHLQTCAPEHFTKKPPARQPLKPVFLINAAGAHASAGIETDDELW
ncbi:MAG: hypothetical protein ACUVTY_09360 [Armatimonadota bacterium]